MKFRRTVLKQELAVKLFPNSLNPESAMPLLRKEIRITPQLKDRLYSKATNNRLHYFTHVQVDILLEHFCISEDEFEQL
jgi:hypothetical protein